MQVGDLVKLKGDPHGVLGVITEIAPDILTKRTIYFVRWVCDMCDDMWSESWDLEAVMKVGDLVKEIYHGTVGIILEIGPDLIQVMFCYGPRSVGCPRWLRPDSLEVVCK